MAKQIHCWRDRQIQVVDGKSSHLIDSRAGEHWDTTGILFLFFLVVADFDWDEKKKKQSFIDMVVYNNIRVFSHRLGYKMAED